MSNISDRFAQSVHDEAKRLAPPPDPEEEFLRELAPIRHLMAEVEAGHIDHIEARRRLPSIFAGSGSTSSNQLTAENSRLKDELDTANTQLENANHEISRLQTELDTANAEKTRLETELAQAKGQPPTKPTPTVKDKGKAFLNSLKQPPQPPKK